VPPLIPGYGNPVPITNVGRVVCIAFSLFGIPLTLVTIADMGWLFVDLSSEYANKIGHRKFTIHRAKSQQKRRKFPGKFLSEHLIWMYGNYLKLKHYLCRRHDHRKDRRLEGKGEGERLQRLTEK